MAQEQPQQVKPPVPQGQNSLQALASMASQLRDLSNLLSGLDPETADIVKTLLLIQMFSNQKSDYYFQLGYLMGQLQANRGGGGDIKGLVETLEGLKELKDKLDAVFGTGSPGGQGGEIGAIMNSIKQIMDVASSIKNLMSGGPTTRPATNVPKSLSEVAKE